MQRSAAVFYLLPIIIYFIFSFRSKSIKPIIASVIGYTIILFLVGTYNYKKSDAFYFFPTEGKLDIYNYFCIPLLANRDKISETEVLKHEVQKAYKWSKDNNIKLKDEFDSDKIKNFMGIANLIEKEKNKIKFYDYLNKKQYEIMVKNPLITIKQTIIRIAHFSVLYPTHVYYYFDYRGNDESVEFYSSQIYKKWIPYRIIYTLLIYFVCFVGLIYFLKQKKHRLLMLLTISILYYTVLLGWTGMPRLFVPNLIYLSFFFGNGLALIINQLKKINNF